MTDTPQSNESHLKVLRLLEADPSLSQRELSDALGVSLGKTNYCIRALLDKGLIKMQNFRNSHNKLAYAYLLTPAGIAAKADLTSSFLKIKMQEYKVLREEIEQLQREAQRPISKI
ncbi:MarR family EPS-associated transcriptional regulator [Alcaligenaceae bacterium CGII-47]|nr:MarR family EPS-associated transcriptional regulator [Alcaligenaceae bacterium CGII-47]